MANPIKTSDLYQDTGELKKLIAELEEVQGKLEALRDSEIKNAAKLEKAVRRQTNTTAQQREEIEASAQQADEIAKRYKKYTDSLSDNAVKIAALKNAQRTLNQVNKLEAKLLTEKEGSYNRLSAQYSLNKLRLNQMSAEERKNTKEGQELVKTTNDIYQEMKRLQEETGKHTLSVGDYTKSIRDASKDQTRLVKELRETKAAFEAASQGTKLSEEVTARYEKRIQELTQQIDNLGTVTGRTSADFQEAEKGYLDAIKVQRQLVKQVDQLKQEFENLPEEVKASDKALEDYQKQVKALNEQIEELSEVTDQSADDIRKMDASSDGLVDQLSNIDGAAGEAVRGVQQLGQSFKALLRNPVVLVIAAIVAGLTLLFNAFTRSEKGADLFAKASGAVQGILSVLTKVAVEVAEAIEWAFTNPQEALKSFGKLLISQIVNRLKGVVDLVLAVGDAIYQSVTLNFDEAEKAAKRAGNAFTQVLTGLDSQQQQQFAEAIKETTKEVVKNAEAFANLETQKRKVRRANRALVKSIEQLTTAEELQRSVADDTTKSFAEREAAAEKARKALEARSKKEIQLAKNNLSLINTELSLRRRNGEEVEDLLDRQLDAYRELSAAERQYTLAVRDNERTRAELKQDRLERDLDILIDGFDNQKSVNERLLNDDRLTLDKRRAILQQTAKLADDSFAKQIQTVQQFTGQAINANELLAESDAVALNEKIRGLGLSEIIEGRLLEIIRERRIANQDLAEAEVELAEKVRSERLKSLQVQQEVAKADFELIKRTESEKAQFILEQKQAQLQAIQELNAQQSTELPPIDTAKLESEIKTLTADLSKARKQTALDVFDEQQALAQSEFELLRTSEKRKTEFRLNAELERLQKILELNAKFGSDLSKQQLQIIKNQIAKIKGELDQLNGSFTDIYDLFGFDIDDPTKSAITESIGFVKGQLQELTNTRVQLAQQNVQAANQEIAAAQRQLDIEIQNRNAGYAHEVSTAQQRLESAKKNQEKALKEQQKAQRAQQRIQTLEQSVSLVTASSKIWASFAGLGPVGPFLAAAAIAAMWGSFIASKIRAAQLTKKQFGEGGLEIIGRGTHASGNDTYLGFHSEGKPAYAERGEAHAIIPAKQTRKYKSILPALVNSLRKGTFEHQYRKITDAGHASDSAPVFIGSGSSTDMSKVEDDVAAIRKQNERTFFRDSEGNLVERYKNLTRVYV